MYKKSSYTTTPFYSLHTSTSNPLNFLPLPYLQFSHKNNIKFNNTALSQTALQQAPLGGTLQSQESVAGDVYPGPNFIIRGSIAGLQSPVSGDDRMCLIPNLIKLVLEASRDWNQHSSPLLVAQVF